MRTIPVKIKKALLADPRRFFCSVADDHCDGRITWSHPLMYRGRQIVLAWATVFACAYHHGVDEYQDGGDYNQEKHVWVALNQATDPELDAISKVINYRIERERLNTIYSLQPLAIHY